MLRVVLSEAAAPEKRLRGSVRRVACRGLQQSFLTPLKHVRQELAVLS